MGRNWWSGINEHFEKPTWMKAAFLHKYTIDDTNLQFPNRWNQIIFTPYSIFNVSVFLNFKKRIGNKMTKPMNGI